MDFDNRLRLHNPANGVSDNAWIDGDDEPWYLDDEDNQVDEVIRAVVSPRRRRSMPRCKQTWHSDSSEPDIGAAPEEVDIEQLLAESLELSPILERVDYQGFSARNMHSQPLHTGAASQLHTLGDDVMIQRRYDSRRSVDLASQFKESSQRKGFSHSQTLPEFPKCEVPGSPPDIRSSLRVQVLTSRSRNRTKSQDSGNAWALEDDDDVIVGSLTYPLGYSSTSSHSPHSPTLTCPPQLYYTTPPRTHMTSLASPEGRSRLDRAGSAKSGLSKLARRLSQKERRQTCVSANADERKKALRQRSVSLDCAEGRRALANNNSSTTQLESTSPQDASLSIPVSPSLPCKLGGSKSGSSSPSIAGRLSRKTSGSKGSRKSPLETTEGGAPSKDKKKRSLYDLHALFGAVERQDMETARMMLDSNGLDVNRVNDDDLTVLDIAIMSNHVPMAKMLLSHGAKENPQFQKIRESRSLKLITLINQTEKHIADLKNSMLDLNMTPGSGSTAATGQQKEFERQLNHMDYRLKLMRRMKSGYDHAQCPEPPTNVQLSVSSSSSLLVHFNEPNHHNGAVVTRYKVEWSCFEDFSVIAGEQVIDDPRCLQYEIPDLVQGNCYYVRVRAWNVKGFGDPCPSCPVSATPSSWREVSGLPPRCEGKLNLLDGVFVGLQEIKTKEGVEKSIASQNGVSPMPPRKSTVRKSIKNLFSSAPKFQKTLKRGVYLACLLCSEDRILVTNEDIMPIIEVDESYSSASLNSDFHWLMKISCNWEDVKSLRREIDKSTSAGVMPFRSKLLQACSQLQSVLGVQDLGQLHHSPIRDSDGSVVLIAVNYIKDPKVVTSTHVKWVSLGKVQRRVSSTVEQLESPLAPESLLSAVPELLSYARLSTFSLNRGLYLGYLKLKSSVDLIRIMVPEALPNVLPHIKIRDCPNISKEEWQWFRNLTLNEMRCPPTPAQSDFQSLLTSACSNLLEHLGISEDEGVSHRLYDVEVIELSEDVSFLLLLPPVEGVCSVPGHQEDTPAQRALQCLSLPVQVFEMIHMSTYQREHLHRFCRASCALETDAHLAQQAQREAFSSEEVSVAKQRVDKLNSLQQTLDEAWKGLRWTLDIIAYARDKTLRGGLPLSILFAPPPSPTDSPSISRKEATTSANDVASSTCSDCGYHSDISSLDSQRDGAAEEAAPEEIWFRASRQPGILRVYAAYETGLARGTSVKLHVTPKTTSREVVNLVVQQLNKAVLCRGLQAPVYGVDELRDFCLVAVIGARERVLRDEYQPLQLQNPWTKGRLYVRLQANLLAAIEHGHVTTV